MTWKEYIDNAEKVLTEHENAINERLVKKSVVRDGKKILNIGIKNVQKMDGFDTTRVLHYL